jgi:hypothetical protein
MFHLLEGKKAAHGKFLEGGNHAQRYMASNADKSTHIVFEYGRI